MIKSITHEELRVRARLAAADNRSADAIDFLHTLRLLTGEAYNPDDKTFLESLTP